MFRATCIGLVETLFVGIPKPIWDALWLASFFPTEGMPENFLRIYHLEIVTIGVGDDAYEAVAPQDGYLSLWVDNSLFIVTPGAACIGGCPLSIISPV